MHDFELSDEHAMILDSVRRFVQDVVDPNTLEYDEHRAFARAGVEGLAELGLYGMLVGDEHGGAGLGMVAFVAVLEALGGGCGSTARSWSFKRR